MVSTEEGWPTLEVTVWPSRPSVVKRTTRTFVFLIPPYNSLSLTGLDINGGMCRPLCAYGACHAETCARVPSPFFALFLVRYP